MILSLTIRNCIITIFLIIVIVFLILNINITYSENFVGDFKPRLNIHEDRYPTIFNPGHQNAIVTLYTPNIATYAQHSIQNIKKYCKMHNLTLYIFNQPLSDEIKHGCWNKIPAILYMFNKTEHKYIIWMDSDAVFNRLDISFDKFINKYANKDLIVCRDIRDEKYKFNSGIMIFKNTAWSKKIIEDTWNSTIPHGYRGEGDQVVLKDQILADGKKDNNYEENSGHKKVALLSEREFNSFPRNEKHRNLGPDTINDFIIHFMGHSTEDRIKYMSEINKKLENQ